MATRAKVLTMAMVAALFVSAHAQPQTAAPAKDFASAYAAASAGAAKAFESLQPVDPDKVSLPLADLAVTDADKEKLEAFRATLARIPELKTPVSANASMADGETLDAGYKKQVLDLAQKLSADGEAALESRRRVLRGLPPVPKNKEVEPDAAKDESEQAVTRGDAASARARKIAGGLEQNKEDGMLIPAGGPASSAHPGATGPDGAPLHAGDFNALKLNLKTTKDVPNAEGGTPPESPSVWSKVKDGLTTNWTAAEEGYKKFADGRMKAADQAEKDGAALVEAGDYEAAGSMATVAFVNRLLAGDKTAVKAVAIGAAVVTAAVVAAPVVATGGLVVAGIEGGLAAWTAYNVVTGTAKLAQEPNVANAGLLALNFATVPYLGKVASAAGGYVEKGVVALENSAKDSKVASMAVATLGAIGTKVGAHEVNSAAREEVAAVVQTAESHAISHEVSETAGEIAKTTVHGTIHKTADMSADELVEAHLTRHEGHAGNDEGHDGEMPAYEAVREATLQMPASSSMALPPTAL